ncbi:accessory gene regulator ArgB-like protein [Inediibacterium massiliense]|uniref:accessory gene regulator ArgB-like protein n=1 Tax=Inediibacterium massiliense TaxID=1658111 RepID=UPI0006B69270|nr:accessory gene regulator B family protein [Inediibacterium massiliense]
MERIAQNITNSIQRNNSNLTRLQILKIKFGLECLLGELTKTILYVGIFSIFSLTKNFLISLLFFCSIRSVAGGYHEATYWRCFCTSFLIFSIAVIAGVQLDISSNVRVIMLLVSMVLVWIYAPVDHPNKPIISELRRKKLKYISLLLSICMGGMSFFLSKNYAITAMMAILLEALSLPMGNFSKRSMESESVKR